MPLLLSNYNDQFTEETMSKCIQKIEVLFPHHSRLTDMASNHLSTREVDEQPLQTTKRRGLRVKPDLVHCLLHLSPEQVADVNISILSDLTSDQLRKINTSSTINVPLSLRIHEADRLLFAANH